MCTSKLRISEWRINESTNGESAVLALTIEFGYQERDDVVQQRKALLEQFRGEQASRTKLPAFALPGRAGRNPQEMIAILPEAATIPLLDIGRDRACAPSQLFHDCTPRAGRTSTRFAVFPHEIVQEQRLALRVELPHRICFDGIRDSRLPHLVCHHPLRCSDVHSLIR